MDGSPCSKSWAGAAMVPPGLCLMQGRFLRGPLYRFSDADFFRLGFNVALKVSVSGTSQHSNEIGILQRLSLGNRNGETHHIVQLLHSFSLEGPNGKHDCIATELLGPSISSARERYRDARLPGHLAWQAVRPTIQALAYMHEKGIVHGGKSCHLDRSFAIADAVFADLHPGNILLPCDDHFRQPDSEALKSLGSPEREAIHVTPYTPSLPRYMVRSISLPLVPRTAKACSFKVIDFGSSFVSGLGTAPQMRCPLPFRAPEALLTGHFDSSADIWSLGCTVRSRAFDDPSMRRDADRMSQDIFPRGWLSAI
jgi:serine/threonine protein kinase